MFVDAGLPTLVDASAPDPANPRQVEHDGYPDVIEDQRHAYRCETVEEIESFWLDTLDRTHRAPWTNDPLDEVDAYINRARLLVDCPACNSGAYAWNRNPLACCLDCGLLFKVRFPSPFELSAAIRLLAVRPVVNANCSTSRRSRRTASSSPSVSMCPTRSLSTSTRRWPRWLTRRRLPLLPGRSSPPRS